ncbi:MAG: polymer-forming cytoskeletal protein [Acidobacteria bacterium]|nr:MAG: polymer-forming cytoskeletal protein [Acidobacteriota bacterium]
MTGAGRGRLATVRAAVRHRWPRTGGGGAARGAIVEERTAGGAAPPARGISRMLPILLALPALAAGTVPVADAVLDVGDGSSARTGGVHAAAGDVVAVSRGKRIDGDLYAAAGTVAIDGTIDGDLLVSAGTVVVGGAIREDLASFSGTLRVTGQVGGDVRAFGGRIELEGEVAGDVLAFGGEARVRPAAQVNGTFLARAADIAIRGTVNGPADLAGGHVRISGPIHGDVRVRCDELEIDPDARLDGDLRYHTRSRVEIPPGVVSGEVSRIELGGEELEAERIGRRIAEGLRRAWRLFRAALAVYFAAVALIAGALMWLFFATFVEGVLDQAADMNGTAVSFGVGLVALFVMLVLGVFCFVLLPLALAVWSALGVLVYAGGILGKMIVGRALLRPVMRRPAHPLLALLAGVVVMFLVELVPYLGTLGWFAVTVTGMGATLLRMRGGAPAAAAPAAAS